MRILGEGAAGVEPIDEAHARCGLPDGAVRAHRRHRRRRQPRRQPERARGVLRRARATCPTRSRRCWSARAGWDARRGPASTLRGRWRARRAVEHGIASAGRRPRRRVAWAGSDPRPHPGHDRQRGGVRGGGSDCPLPRPSTRPCGSGTNWPNGPLAWGEERGLAAAVATLDDLAAPRTRRSVRGRAAAPLPGGSGGSFFTEAG